MTKSALLSKEVSKSEQFRKRNLQTGKLLLEEASSRWSGYLLGRELEIGNYNP